MGEKNCASVVPQQNAPYAITVNSIPQPAATAQVPVPKILGKKSKRERHTLGLYNKAYAVAIKCYDEQLVKGRDFTFSVIRNTSKKDFQIIAIVHDRDTVTDGIWLASLAKPHVHIILRNVDRNKRIRVRQLLDSLGIFFRPGLDDTLWMEHGVETVGDYTKFAVYLTHETKEAIDEAKELYSIDELISNLSKDEIIHIRDGYTRVSANAHKVIHDELAALDQDAYNLGYEMKNFAQWFDNQPFAVRSQLYGKATSAA